MAENTDPVITAQGGTVDERLDVLEANKAAVASTLTSIEGRLASVETNENGFVSASVVAALEARIATLENAGASASPEGVETRISALENRLGY